MKPQDISQLSRGLLAHLHLSAAEAAVMLDERHRQKRLVVLIYDTAASRRVPKLREWQGYPVSIVRDLAHGPH